jgi:CheY-like chemotaxis protein
MTDRRAWLLAHDAVRRRMAGHTSPCVRPSSRPTVSCLTKCQSLSLDRFLDTSGAAPILNRNCLPGDNHGTIVALPVVGIENMIRVGVADDHTMFREMLRIALPRNGDMEVVGEAADGPELSDVLYRSRPDVVLIDYKMPFVRDFVAFLEQLRAQNHAFHRAVGILYRRYRHAASGMLLAAWRR